MNLGEGPLSEVTISDDKCSPVTLLGGDTNGDGLLDGDETWSYRCAAILAQDTTNTATAEAVDMTGMPVSPDSELAFVRVIHPAISLVKTAEPTVISAGDIVTYTYVVANAGDIPLSNVSVSDDKCSPVTLLGGDRNGNQWLEPDETWTYRCIIVVYEDTTNTATVMGTDTLGAMVTAGDTAFVDVGNSVFLPLLDRNWAAPARQ
jgi:hypothetical protein